MAPLQAAKRHGMSREQVEEAVAKLEALLPALSPNLDKMRASDWVTVLRDTEMVAVKLVVLKSYYPTVDLTSVLARSPRFLLADVDAMQADAQQIQAILGSKLNNLDAVIQAVPDLMRPAQAMLTLSNLKRWFPTHDVYDLLQKNPTILYQIEEADLDPDPTYGERVVGRVVVGAGGGGWVWRC
jgi:hypothetical protein